MSAEIRKARVFREQHGWSLRQAEDRFLERFGVKLDHSAIDKFEKGTRMLRGGNLQRYAEVLGCSIDEMLKPAEAETKQDAHSA